MEENKFKIKIFKNLYFNDNDGIYHDYYSKLNFKCYCRYINNNLFGIYLMHK